MADPSTIRRLPPIVGLVATGLVIAGVLLWMFVNQGLLVVAGAGAFGPGILRELGWLRDQDEFERQAARRAGYHAYLVGGLAATVIVSGLRWGTVEPPISSEWITLILLVLWTTWLFSSLLAFWGAPKTASRVLVTFGSFWAVFVLAHIIGDVTGGAGPGETIVGALVGTGVVLPFFALAWTARRWPRPTGLVLLGVAGLFALVFIVPQGALALQTRLVTADLLLVPLIAPAIALLRDPGLDADDDVDAKEAIGA